MLQPILIQEPAVLQQAHAFQTLLEPIAGLAGRHRAVSIFLGRVTPDPFALAARQRCMTEHRPGSLVREDFAAPLADHRARGYLDAIELVLHRGPVGPCWVVLRQARLEANVHAALGHLGGHHLAQGRTPAVLKRAAMGGRIHRSPLPVLAKSGPHHPDMGMNMGFTGLVLDVNEDQRQHLGLGPLHLAVHPLSNRLVFELPEGLPGHGFHDGDGFVDALAAEVGHKLASLRGQGDDQFDGGMDGPLDPWQPGEAVADLTLGQASYQAARHLPVVRWTRFWIGDPADVTPKVRVPDQRQELAIP